MKDAAVVVKEMEQTSGLRDLLLDRMSLKEL